MKSVVLDGHNLRSTVLRLRALRRETVRREIVRGGRIDLLASHVLGYDVRPFHQQLIDFQEAAPDTCLQLAPRGYGKSTILTITRAVYEILRNPNIRILIAANTQLQAEVFNKSDKVKELKNKAKNKNLTEKQKKQLTEEEKEYKSKRKLVQEKLIKFATRIPAFMYLTDFRENTDVITKLEPELFLAVTGLTVKDFHLLVQLKVFNTEQMNQAVFAFRRYEDASLRYTGIESHPGLTHYGLYDTVVAREDAPPYETAG